MQVFRFRFCFRFRSFRYFLLLFLSFFFLPLPFSLLLPFFLLPHSLLVSTILPPAFRAFSPQACPASEKPAATPPSASSCLLLRNAPSLRNKPGPRNPGVQDTPEKKRTNLRKKTGPATPSFPLCQNKKGSPRAGQGKERQTQAIRARSKSSPVEKQNGGRQG